MDVMVAIVAAVVVLAVVVAEVEPLDVEAAADAALKALLTCNCLISGKNSTITISNNSYD